MQRSENGMVILIIAFNREGILSSKGVLLRHSRRSQTRFGVQMWIWKSEEHSEVVMLRCFRDLDTISLTDDNSE